MSYAQLAWSLAETCSHCLNESEKCAVYVALGSGDTRTAISKLVKAAARQHVTLSTETAVALRAWWVAHDDARGVSRRTAVLIGQLTTPSAPRPSPMTPGIRPERKYLQTSRQSRKLPLDNPG
jgi:hypothetical protein